MSAERRVTQYGTIGLAKRADGQQVIRGYGAVCYLAGDPGTEYRPWSDFVERIAPGAFDRAIKEKHDARGLYNHDPDHLLGRVGAGTMSLSVDSRGLVYEITPPDTQIGRDVVTSIGRGDLAGSSFAFMVRKQSWSEEVDDKGNVTYYRTIEDVDLFDVGPVTFPAYEATTTGLRDSRQSGDLRDALEGYLAGKRARMAEAVRVRMRMIEIENGA